MTNATASKATADDSALADHGAQVIAKGSKSFAIASLLLGSKMQAHAQMLYAWCRYCDDIIDGQELGGDAPDGSVDAEEHSVRLNFLRDNTARVLNGEITGNPSFDGLGSLAKQLDLPKHYTDHLLNGFQMDVTRQTYETLDDLMEYCYGVAGVVGVMMAIIMGVDKEDGATLNRACDLGIAFQLTNICRDVIDDARGGRVYFPTGLLADVGVDASPETIAALENRRQVYEVALILLGEADKYYQSASEGIKHLPIRAAGAIAAARNIYREIGRLLINGGPDAWKKRIFVSKKRKYVLALSGVFSGIPQPLLKAVMPGSPRQNLWMRPQ